MEALLRAYDEGNLESYLAFQPLSVKKAIKRMMQDNNLVSNMIDDFASQGIGIISGPKGEMHFRREDICKRDHKLIALLKNSDTHMINQLIETEAPDERRSFKDFQMKI